MSKDTLKDFEDRVSRFLMHRKKLPGTISQVDLPAKGLVHFVYLSGDKLYTAADSTLYVYLMSDTTSPIATYSLTDECYSGIVSENFLYLGGKHYLEIFELTTSITQPLTPVTQITTNHWVFKVLRVGN